MSDLTDFLLARIDETEDAANNLETVEVSFYRRWEDLAEVTPDAAAFSPARVLAECEAKRRIVEHCDASSQCGSYLPPGDERDKWLAETQQAYGYTPPLHYPEEYAAGCDGCSGAESVTQNDGWILRLLALPYADHADYDESWRP